MHTLSREITRQEGQDWAEQNGLLFTECSAKSNQNVKAVFERLSEEILRKIKSAEIDIADENGGVKLGDYKTQLQAEPERKCC